VNIDIPDTMTAAVLHAPRDFRLEDVPVPTPSPDQALVRVTVNGICGSDLHFFERGELGPFRVTRPYIPGHEAAGIVARPAASGLGPPAGTRVAVEPGIPCRRCPRCKSGRYNLCPHVRFLSCPPEDGTFAPFVAIEADFAHPIPHALSDEAAAFVEPVSVALQACLRAGVRAGDSALVLGAGPIGLLTLLVARAFGATPLYISDVLPRRLELARSLGADHTLDAADPDLPGTLEELTGGDLPRHVLDASGASAAAALAPRLAGRGAVLTLIGWPDTSPVPFPLEVVLERELDVRGVNRYSNTYPRAIALLAAGRIPTDPLVSHRFPFARVVEAFRFAAANRDQTVKVLVSEPA
jgi:L-iditol 2-dehydrogenase